MEENKVYVTREDYNYLMDYLRRYINPNEELYDFKRICTVTFVTED